MKKIFALLLVLAMVFSLAACSKDEPAPEQTEEPVIEEPVVEEPEPEPTPEVAPVVEAVETDLLAEAAMETTGFRIICSCSEELMSAAAKEFEAIYGIEVEYELMSPADALAAIEEGASADLWMGAPAALLNEAKDKGLLTPYTAENTMNIFSESFRADDGSWYGCYADALGFTVNSEKFADGEIPSAIGDLPKYEGMICLSLGSSEGAESVASGEYVLALGEMSYGVAKALDGDTLDFVVPGDFKCVVYGVGILSGGVNTDAAKLWIEFCLSSDFADPAGLAAHGLFPLVASAGTPAIAAALELDISKAIPADISGSEILPELVIKMGENSN